MNMTTDHAHEVADEEVSKSPSTGCYVLALVVTLGLYSLSLSTIDGDPTVD